MRLRLTRQLHPVLSRPSGEFHGAIETVRFLLMCCRKSPRAKKFPSSVCAHVNFNVIHEIKGNSPFCSFSIFPQAADFQMMVEKKTSCRFLLLRSSSRSQALIFFLFLFGGIYFHVFSRFPRCRGSRMVRASIKVYFRRIACSLNWDLHFKRVLFKWRTRPDPSL